MKNKIWVIIVIVLIIILGICVYFYIKNGETQETLYGNLERTNRVTNNVEQNVVQNETKNEVVQNTQKENTQTNAGGNTSSETLPENPKTAEEKALSIVKKDYGEPSGISFRVEGMDNNGKYIVKVVDMETTAVLEYYYVDVEQGTFTK